MKQRPMLFTGPMVRATLDGRKGQTRRIMNPQPEGEPRPLEQWSHGIARACGKSPTDDEIKQHVEKLRGRVFPFTTGYSDGLVSYPCPYGRPGDQLWIRETWGAHFMYDDVKPSEIYHEDGDSLWCRATSDDKPISGRCVGSQRGKWRPSIFMPRWASRILLEITDIRVERLQAISQDDCRAEGCPGGHDSIPDYGYSATPREHFEWIWESINGKGSFYAANPFVWVIEFKRVEV